MMLSPTGLASFGNGRRDLRAKRRRLLEDLRHLRQLANNQYLIVVDVRKQIARRDRAARLTRGKAFGDAI